MDFSATGDNLNILICTDYDINSDWQSFALWYSIHKYMPSAKVAISCSRNKQNVKCLYTWTTKCGVKCFQHKNTTFLDSIRTSVKNQVILPPLLCLKPDIIAINELTQETVKELSQKSSITTTDGKIIFIKSKGVITEPEFSSNLNDTFVGYDLLTKFKLEEWQEKKNSPPFNIFWKFHHDNITAKEAKILNLWKKMRYVYDILRYIEL